jgi:hypothetical protein
MKPLLFSCLLLAPLGSFAQWQPNPYTAGNIYFNGGDVGAGTNIPTSDLQTSRSNADINLFMPQLTKLSGFPNMLFVWFSGHSS